MLYQNACVVPLGIIAIVNVDGDEEDWFAPLLHALVARPAAAAQMVIARRREIRCCIRSSFMSAFCLRFSLRLGPHPHALSL